MSTLQIISPINDARFESLKPVTFTGKVDPGIVTVELKADEQYSLGSGQVKTDGSWSITYSGFTNSQVLRNFEAVCEQLNLSIPP